MMDEGGAASRPSGLIIGDQRVGVGSPCFVIAEAGVNHNGSLDRALSLVDAAVEAGADAVKFQTFQADRLAVASAPKAAYQLRTTDPSESQVDMLRRLELSVDELRRLREHAHGHGIQFLSTPFDEVSADLLEELRVPAFKIASGELTNLPLLVHVAQKGKPMLVSTGMATLDEVDTAVRAIRTEGNTDVVLLQCTSAYPANPHDANLRVLETMRARFGISVGYSDHTCGSETAIAAVAMGACVLERHLTVDRRLPGPDHAASFEPTEFGRLVKSIRIVEAALGDGRKVPAASEENTAAVARKSLVAARDIAAGEVLTGDLIAIRRPGTGLPPAMRTRLVGRTVRVAVPRGTLLTPEVIR